MKKILILFVVLFSLISVERLHTVEDTEQICELLLKNVDAMASGAEIIIGPFCIQTDRTCFVDYDGFFVRGYRHFFISPHFLFKISYRMIHHGNLTVF